jgi:hypothetical protein
VRSGGHGGARRLSWCSSCHIGGGPPGWAWRWVFAAGVRTDGSSVARLRVDGAAVPTRGRSHHRKNAGVMSVQSSKRYTTVRA